MIENYIEEQPLITNLLLKEIENNKIVQAYMFCHYDIDYIFNYAISFSKNLICEGLDKDIKEDISNKIDKGVYNELCFLEPINNIIRKEQFLELKQKINKKPVEGKKIVYIIKNCEKLNVATANAMLKFIEDSTEDLIAIFLTSNVDLVIPTIKSRCQLLNFSNVSKNRDIKDVIEKISVHDEEVIDKLMENSIKFITEIENKGINVIYSQKQMINDLASDSALMDLFLTIMLYFYYDVFNNKILNVNKYFTKYADLINQVSRNLEHEKIIKKINTIEKVKTDNLYNLNQKLMFDRLILELCEV